MHSKKNSSYCQKKAEKIQIKILLPKKINLVPKKQASAKKNSI